MFAFSGAGREQREERRLEGTPPQAVGSGGLPGVPGRGAAREGEGWRAEAGVGWERRLSAFLLAPPRRPLRTSVPGRGRPATLPHVASSPVSLFPPDFPATSLEVGLEVSGGGMLRAPPPHTTGLRPWRRSRLPFPRPRTAWRGSSGRVSRAVWRDGWRLPVAGPLALPRRLPPPALDRSASAGRRSSAALGLPRGRQAPPHALGASGLCPLHASRGFLSGSLSLSPLYLCRVPYQLGATLPVGALSLPSVVGEPGGGCLGTRAWVGALVVGEEDGVRGGRQYGCARLVGEGSAPFRENVGVVVWRRPGWAAVDCRTAGPPCVTGWQRRGPRAGTRWLVVDVGAVACGARRAPRPPPTFQVPSLSRRRGLKAPALTFPRGSDGKVSAYNAGDPGLIPGSVRSGGGNGNPLQYFAWKIPWTGGTW